MTKTFVRVKRKRDEITPDFLAIKEQFGAGVKYFKYARTVNSESGNLVSDPDQNADLKPVQHPTIPKQKIAIATPLPIQDRYKLIKSQT
jgi:hypothetical protein